MQVADTGKTKERVEYEHMLEELDREMNLLLYAISHDLRAPLRSIDGFSLAVIEDYGDVLDDIGKDFLRRIQGAGHQLNGYIEALLQLSRETRGNLVPEFMDLSTVAKDVVAELRKRYAGRKVEFTIQKEIEGVLRLADQRLVRVLLEKLLDNAWKFTGRKEHAHVEFGMTEEPNGPTYFVADNGAGFDEKYAEPRLFGAFQRMHSLEDFEGLGMGLATARRIVNRHRGRIWARSEVNQGTVIHFTLPDKVVSSQS